MPNLRAGLIGLGMMGRHHARVLSSLAGVDFVGICDPAGDVSNSSQGRPIHNSISQLIALGLDYAIVAVPTIYHLKICHLKDRNPFRIVSDGIPRAQVVATAAKSSRLASVFWGSAYALSSVSEINFCCDAASAVMTMF